MRVAVVAAAVVVVAAAVLAGCAPADDEFEPNDSADEATAIVFGDEPLHGVVVPGNDDFYTLGDRDFFGPVRWHLDVAGGEETAGLLLPDVEQLECAASADQPPPRLLCNDDGSFDLDIDSDTVRVREGDCGFCLRGGDSPYTLSVAGLPSR